MKKIYATGAISMVADHRGFAFTALQTELADTEKSVIAYKRHDFDSGSTELITRTAFLLTKFGLDYEKYTAKIDDYINCRAVMLANGEMFVTHPDGKAVMFDRNARVKWQGNIKYKGFGPACVVEGDGCLWCTYPENTSIIKYGTEFMRRQLFISTANRIDEPFGLATVGDSLYVTCASTGLISAINLENFSIETVVEFGEPVYEYLKIDSNEVVLAQSGIYRL